MGKTVRHIFRNPTLGQTSPSSFSNCTTLQPTDRHNHERTVTSSVGGSVVQLLKEDGEV